MTAALTGRTIAFLMANSGVEQIELTGPKEALEAAGATVVLLAPDQGEIQAMNNDVEPADTFQADLAVAAADPSDFDALVLPGGTTNPDALRLDEDAVGFVRSWVETGKLTASICHGPWTLVEAGVLGGKTLSSWPSLRTDLTNAGATWVDEEVFVCPAKGWTLISSRNPDDVPAFGEALVSALSPSRQQ